MQQTIHAAPRCGSMMSMSRDAARMAVFHVDRQPNLLIQMVLSREPKVHERVERA
jgi:hypothetical protein